MSRGSAELPPPSDRPRRLAGWGYEEEWAPAPHAMIAWLEAALGPGERHAVTPPRLTKLPRARRLPPLPVSGSSDPLVRLANARGMGIPDLLWLRAGRAPSLPDTVLRPAEREIAPILTACADAGVRVVPRGGGTSVTGGVNVPSGDQPVVVLDLRGIGGLYALDAESGLATFGAGIVGPRIEAALATHGFTLGHLPQSWELSTLGGWVVTRSAGQESLGYGRIEDLVAGLELEAPAGRLSLAPRPASAAGPDLRQLVLGSEGRLGVVTRVTVRVRPRPAAREVRAWILPDWEAGVAAARSLVRGGVPLSLLRLSDAVESEAALAVGLGMGAVGALGRGYLALRGVAGGCMLLAGAAGEGADLKRAFSMARHELAAHGAVSLGRSPGERWLEDRFRHPYLRDSLLDLGYAAETLETAAPWSRLATAYGGMTKALSSGLEAEGERVAVLCHLSHPYVDGASLYFTCFYRTPAALEPALERWARLKRVANDALVYHGLTVSHHHGVGTVHAHWLVHETGEAGLRAVGAAATQLDPAGVLNPHVLLDPTDRLLE